MRRVRTLVDGSAKLPLAVLFVAVFVLCLTASTDGDVFWHLAAGREIIDRGALLRTDIFSLSARNRPWVDVHWLFQVMCATAFRLGGLRALVLGKAFIVACGALLLGGVVHRRAGARALPLFVLVELGLLLSVRDLLLLRPTIITLLFIAAFIYTIESVLAGERPRRLWALPLLQVVWVNVQGLFALGPAIIFAYWLGMMLEARLGRARVFPFAVGPAQNSDRTRRAGLSLALAGSLLGCTASPFGIRAVLLSSELLRRLTPGASNAFSNEIAENVPPFLLEQQTGQFWHLKWFLLGLAVVVVIAGRRLRAHHCILVGGFLLLALMANRNVLLLYWVAAPLAVGYLYRGALYAMPRARTIHVWLRRGTYTGALALFAVAINESIHEPPLGAPAPFRVPELSARWILERGGTSRIFAADHYGGYLIWTLFPRHAPYIDTRLILRTEQEFSEYLRVVDDPARFDAFDRRERFDYVVLPTAYPDRYLALLRHLYESDNWQLVLSDGSETLFARSSLGQLPRMDLGAAITARTLLADFERRYPDPRVRADARLQLATLQLALGHPAEAERALGSSEDVGALALRARARLAQGDASSAGRIAIAALNANPHHVRSLNLLAVISLERGEFGKAMGYLRAALRANAFDPEALSILHSLEAKPNDPIN